MVFSNSLNTDQDTREDKLNLATSLWKKTNAGVLNIQNSWGFQLKSSSWHFGSETPLSRYQVFRRRRFQQTLACKFCTVDLFFFTVTLSCNKFRWHLSKWQRNLNVLHGAKKSFHAEKTWLLANEWYFQGWYWKIWYYSFNQLWPLGNTAPLFGNLMPVLPTMTILSNW